MLGSMLTNLLFVFGVSCLVGGLRWQVQELRITSGNVNIVMLLVCTAGSLLPAALAMSGQMKQTAEERSSSTPSQSELTFCRVNAAVMVVMYISYLLFQLGTHKEEFDDEENVVETPDHLLLMTPHYTSRHGRKKRAERNRFCLRWFGQGYSSRDGSYEAIEMMAQKSHDEECHGLVEIAGETSDISSEDESSSPQSTQQHDPPNLDWRSDTNSQAESASSATRRRAARQQKQFVPVSPLLSNDTISLDGALDNKKEKFMLPPPAKRKQSRIVENGDVADSETEHHHEREYLIVATICFAS